MIETISYEGQFIECAPHCGAWGFRPAGGVMTDAFRDLEIPARTWMAMADRKAAAREVAGLVHDMLRPPATGALSEAYSAAGLGLLLVLLSLVPVTA
jgi:hypothetical protein